MLLSKVTYKKYICQRKEEQYIAVGAVKKFVQTKCLEFTIAKVNPFPGYNQIVRISALFK